MLMLTAERNRSLAVVQNSLHDLTADVQAKQGDVPVDLDALEGAIAKAALPILRTIPSTMPPQLRDLAISAAATPADAEAAASALRRAGDQPGAEALLRRAALAHPQDGPLLIECASHMMRSGDEASVKWLLSRAAALPDTIEGRAVRARLYRIVGRSEQAELIERELEDAIRSADLDLGSRVALADLMLSRGALSTAAYALRSVSRDASSRPATGFGRRADVVGKRVTNGLSALQLSRNDAAQLFEKAGAETIYSPEAYIERMVAILANRPVRSDSSGMSFLVNTIAMGGSERNAVTVANAFAARGDQGAVSLLVSDPVADGHFLAALAPEVTQVDLFRRPLPGAGDADADATIRSLLEAMPLRGFANAVARLAMELSERRPRVLHVFASDVRNIIAGLAGLMAGVPVIVLNPGGLAPESRGFGASYQQNMRWMRAAYRALLATGRMRLLHCSIAALREYNGWLDLDETAGTLQGVNYYGLDAEVWRSDPARVAALRDSLGLSPDHFVVGTAFRFEQVKRPLFWIEVAEALLRRRPGTRFLMLGDGSLHKAVRAAASAGPLSDALVLPGRQEDMPNYYALMSAFLLTSLAEGFGNVLLEAQAAGLPVVAPLVGGMPETFVHGRSGFVVMEDDADAFAERLAWIADRPDWRAEASAFGRRFVKEQFPPERMIADCLRAYGSYWVKADLLSSPAS